MSVRIHGDDVTVDWMHPIRSRYGAGILPHSPNRAGAAGAGSDTARDRRGAT